jgi:hypothetical protein
MAVNFIQMAVLQTVSWGKLTHFWRYNMFSAYFEHKSLLHTVLRLNAAFSGLFGLVFVLFSGSLSGWLGIPGAAALIITGILLIGWEVYVLQLVRQPQIEAAGVWTVIFGDLAWVSGSIGLLIGGWLPLTKAGVWFVAIIADIVLVFAVLQSIGLKRQPSSS